MNASPTGGRVWVVVASVILASACSTPELLAEGAPCVRASQCQAGLACVGGLCSPDVTSLADGAVTGLADAGSDGGRAIDGSRPRDAAPTRDAVVPPRDSSATPDAM